MPFIANAHPNFDVYLGRKKNVISIVFLTEAVRMVHCVISKVKIATVTEIQGAGIKIDSVILEEKI